MSEVQIQCPECGGMIYSGMLENDFSERIYFCNKCDKNFTEAEIRKRCGL